MGSSEFVREKVCTGKYGVLFSVCGVLHLGVIVHVPPVDAASYRVCCSDNRLMERLRLRGKRCVETHPTLLLSFGMYVIFG